MSEPATVNRNRDAQIARDVFKWTKVTNYLPPITVGGSYAQPFGNPPDGTTRRMVPFYSTDFTAAQRILDHLKSQGYGWQLSSILTGVNCRFYYGAFDVTEWGETVAQSIVLAAIKLIDQIEP